MQFFSLFCRDLFEFMYAFLGAGTLPCKGCVIEQDISIVQEALAIKP